MLRRLVGHILDPQWLNVYIGLYLTSLPFLFLFPANSLLIGIQVTTGVVIAGIGAASAVSKYPGLGLINVPVGLFALGLPFLFGFVANTSVMVQDIVAGTVVACVAIAGEAIHMARAARTERETEEEKPTEVGARRIA